MMTIEPPIRPQFNRRWKEFGFAAWLSADAVRPMTISC
jgi:hypothetical protein